MCPRWHEVQAAVYPIVLHVPSVEPALVREVLAELLVDVRGADSPRVLAVDGVPEPWRVYYREPQLDAAFFDFHRFFFDCGRLLYSICKDFQLNFNGLDLPLGIEEKCLGYLNPRIRGRPRERTIKINMQRSV